MGNAANKCSDVTQSGAGAPKPLDASSSEEEDEDEDGDDSEDDSEDDTEDRRHDAELALQEGLKRGKTAVFKEVLDHATAIGIDEDKILKAEAKLEEHKATRRREAFEAELRDFLSTEEANNLEACQEKEREALGYSTSDKNLEGLRERIAELTLCRDLEPDELDQVKQFMETCARRFLNSCLKGRDVVWVDLSTGKKAKALFNLDVTLKNIIINSTKDSSVLAKCRLDDASAKRAQDVVDVTNTPAWEILNDFDRENGVCVFNPGEPWIVVEGSLTKVDEFVIAFTLLAGMGADMMSPSRNKKRDKKKDDKTLALDKGKPPEDEKSPPASPRKPAKKEDQDDIASPKAEKKEKKDKKEKKEKK